MAVNIDEAIGILSKEIPKDQIEYWFETEDGYVFSFKTLKDPQPLRHHVMIDKASGKTHPYPEDRHFVEIAIADKHYGFDNIDTILHSLDLSIPISYVL